jgi:hypothetical protein
VWGIRPVPATKVERRLSVQKGDHGQNAPERARSPCALVRDTASDVLAPRPRQREPAAQMPTLRATMPQRRCPRPLRPPQLRVLGFQDQAGRAVRTVLSRNGTRPLARRRSGRMRAQSSFRRAWSFSSRAWPYGWHDRRAGSRPAVIAAFYSPPTSPRVGSWQPELRLLQALAH